MGDRQDVCKVCKCYLINLSFMISNFYHIESHNETYVAISSLQWNIKKPKKKHSYPKLDLKPYLSVVIEHCMFVRFHCIDPSQLCPSIEYVQGVVTET